MADLPVPEEVREGVLVELSVPPEPRPLLLEVANISKSFPGVRALDDVSVTVNRGEVHCWIGENGAGKSTLVKILAGAQSPDSGKLRIAGVDTTLSSPHVAQSQGLSFIFQELSVVNGLSVADNILLGNEISRAAQVRSRASRARARELLSRIGFGYLDPRRRVGRLTIAEKQAVMVARALNIDAQIIFMDETTASLDRDEVDKLFEVVTTLKSEGRSVVFVSHRLSEVEQIADRITVFKDGRVVGTYASGEISVDEMVRLMVGRDIDQAFPRRDRPRGALVMEAKSLSTDHIRGVELSLHEGEIIGVAGLVGSGRTELLRCLFGIDAVRSGELIFDGKSRRFRNCRQAIGLGIGLVPGDRLSQGIVGLRSVEENITLTWTLGRHELGWKKKSKLIAQKYVDELRIATPNISKKIGFLSGGNQQKGIVARWLAVRPRVLLLDEPTKGIDVGAKSEMYRLIDKLAREGMAVVMVSSDLPELMGLANEICVMREGEFAGRLPGHCAEEEVMSLAMGHISGNAERR